MSAWNHTVCDDCWYEREGGRTPSRVDAGQLATCCFCGEEHVSGIYQRVNPDDPDLVCGGSHAYDEQGQPDVHTTEPPVND